MGAYFSLQPSLCIRDAIPVAKALSKPPQIFSLKGIGRLSHVHSYIKVLPKFSLKNKNACDSQLLLICPKKRGEKSLEPMNVAECNLLSS